MEAIIRRLRQICMEHPLQEKLLIVDTYSIGQAIKHAYVSRWGHVVQLKIQTVHDLAMNVMESRAEQPFTMLENAVGTQFIYRILQTLKEKERLNYFSGVEVTPTISHQMYQTIILLRQNGYTSKTLKKEAFISEEKANDLIKIMSEYEKALEENQFIDEANLFQLATTYSPSNKGSFFILQSNLTLTKLAHDFLQQILGDKGDKVVKLPLPVVYGLSIPEHEDLRSVEWGEATPFSYLYHSEEIKEKPKLTLYTAKSEEVELKQVFEQIKKLNRPLDDSTIFYTKSEPYVTAIYQLAEKYQIPVTFGDGVSILYSRPGRLVASLLQWIKDKYSVPIFIDIMNEGFISLPEGAPSKSKISKYLRDAQVGWSQNRYTIQLESLKIHIQNKLSEATSSEQADYYTNQINDISWLQRWFKQLFKRLPNVVSELNYFELLKGISYILQKQANTSSLLDELAKEELLEQISVILPYANETLNQYDAFEKVKELLLSLRINSSSPKPGHLHVCSYRKGVYNIRKHVFIVGLDNRSFPGVSSEDPLLLDDERIQLSHFLPILKEKGNENLYTMIQLLSHTKGPVTFSYCSFDMNDNRSVNPAHIFLQGYRIAKGHLDADFKEIKHIDAPLISPSIFEEKDYWNGILDKGKPTQLESNLFQLYPNLIHGEEAEMARKDLAFTAWDGKVTIDENLYDPRKNKEYVLSSGKLERLATCSYSYFLQDILRVKPIEETSFDAYSWLDPATRGSLLHKIFEMFYKELDGDRPNVQNHKHLILKIANEQIEEQKMNNQPPSERVFEREVNDIHQCCLIFLKEEEAYSENYKAERFEYAFGLNGEDPAEIQLPSKETIRVRGVVDRVDRANDGHYHIIDYKTGSTYNYHDHQPFKGGRQLQHFVYALAIEEHLKLEAGTVKESSYYFPSSRALGERYVRKQEEALRTNGLKILEKLIDVIKYGHFAMTDDSNDCTFCEFKAVCRREFYSSDTLGQKQMDKNARGVISFKEVRAYD